MQSSFAIIKFAFADIFLFGNVQYKYNKCITNIFINIWLGIAYQTNVWLRKVGHSEESKFSKLKLENLCFQNHFSRLIRGLGGFDSSNKNANNLVKLTF